MSIVDWGLTNSNSGSQQLDPDPYIGSKGVYCTFGGCIAPSNCWYISEDTPICNPPVAIGELYYNY